MQIIFDRCMILSLEVKTHKVMCMNALQCISLDKIMDNLRLPNYSVTPYLKTLVTMCHADAGDILLFEQWASQFPEIPVPEYSIVCAQCYLLSSAWLSRCISTLFQSSTGPKWFSIPWYYTPIASMVSKYARDSKAVGYILQADREVLWVMCQCRKPEVPSQNALQNTVEQKKMRHEFFANLAHRHFMCMKFLRILR